MKRLIDIARGLAPRVLMAGALETACSGLAGATGTAIEVGLGIVADSAVRRSGTALGPTIQGEKVYPIRITSIEEFNASVTAHKLSAETFDRYEHRLMDGMTIARGDNPRRALEYVDKFHMVDVSNPDYRKWTFTEGANPTPADITPNLHVSGIVVPVMRDFAEQSYMTAKMDGEIIYEHIRRVYGGVGFTYRRLIDPVEDRIGAVVRLHVLVVVEQGADEFISSGVR